MKQATMAYVMSQMPYETVNYLPPLKQISFIFVQTILTDHNEASLYQNIALSSVSVGINIFQTGTFQPPGGGDTAVYRAI